MPASHFAARRHGARFPFACASLLAVAVAACDRLASRPAAHDDHDAHDEHAGAPAGEHAHDEAPSRQFTLVDHGIELFVEHPLAVVGEPVRFVTHVTDVASGSPRTAGVATLRCTRDGAAPVEVRVEAPARAGIYLPEITLQSAGDWRAELTLTHVDAPGGALPGGHDLTIALPTVTAFADLHEAQHAEVDDPPEGISFLKEQQWRLKTLIAPVTRQRLVEEIRVAGFVDAPPAARAQVSAPMAGRLVAAPRPWPELGAAVKQGDVLAFVEPQLHELIVAQAQAQAEQVQARVAVAQAAATLARTKTLFEQQAKSARELEEAEFAAKTANARIYAADAVVAAFAQTGLVPRVVEGRLESPRLALAAPIDGIVVAIEGVAGEHVGPERAIFALLDPRVLHVEARVPEIDLTRLAAEPDAAYSLPGVDGPPIPITGSGGGQLEWRGIEIDPTTRTALFHFSLPDPERRLRLGQALAVHLTTRTATDALALPESALIDEDGSAVVYVQLSGETFERRDVTLGIRDRGVVEITAGLVEGERVVVGGAYAVRLASVSASLPAHSHEH